MAELTAIRRSERGATPGAARISADLTKRIELARVVLIAAIVVHHIRMPLELSLYTWSDLGYERGFIQIGLLKSAISTLTIVSGYLCFSSRFEAEPFRFLNKKFRTLVVPLIIFNIPMAIAVAAFQREGAFIDKYNDLAHGGLWNWTNAILGLTEDPVNTPLHFVRNLIACNLIAIVIAVPFRRHTWAALAAIVLVGVFDLDGHLVPRDDILIGFFMGAALASAQVDTTIIDGFGPLFATLYIVSAFLIFHFRIDYESSWWLLHRLLGFLAAWPLIGSLSRTRIGHKLLPYSRYMFFVFLTHYMVGIALFHVFVGFFGLARFPIYVIIAAPATIALCILGQKLAARLMPGFLRFATGGRARASGGSAGPQ